MGSEMCIRDRHDRGKAKDRKRARTIAAEDPNAWTCQFCYFADKTYEKEPETKFDTINESSRTKCHHCSRTRADMVDSWRYQYPWTIRRWRCPNCYRRPEDDKQITVSGLKMVCEGCKHRFEEDEHVLEFIPLPLPPRPEGDLTGSDSAVQSAAEATPGRKKRTRRGGQKRRRREDGSGMSDAADNEDERMLSEGERDQAGRTPRGGGSNREPYAHLAQQTPLLSYQRPQAVWPDEMSTDDLQMPQPSSPSAERAAPVERARVLPPGIRYNTTTDSMLGFQQLEQPEASPCLLYTSPSPRDS